MNFVEKNLERWFTVDMGFEQSYPDKFMFRRSGGGYMAVVRKLSYDFDLYAGNIPSDQISDSHITVTSMVLGHLVEVKADISRIQFCDEKEAVA